jgi:hypothetical protein
MCQATLISHALGLNSVKPFNFNPNTNGMSDETEYSGPHPIFSLDSGWKEPLLAFACTKQGDGNDWNIFCFSLSFLFLFIRFWFFGR